MQTGPGPGRSWPSLQDRHSSSLTRLPSVTSPEARCQAHKVDEARQRPAQGEMRQSRSKEPWVQPHTTNRAPAPPCAERGADPESGRESPGSSASRPLCPGAKPTLSKGSKALPESTQRVSGGFELGREAGRLLKGTGFLLGRQMAPKVAQSVNVLHGIVHLNEELIQSKRASLVAQW